MQYRVELNPSANYCRRRAGHPTRTSKWFAVAVIVTGIVCASSANVGQAQDEMVPGMNSVVVDPGVPPMTDFGGGEFFSQELGTTLRVRYSTESYGQHGDGHGNLDIGTMQVATFDDALMFFDGQVTLNDVQGIGFNIGVEMGQLIALSLILAVMTFWRHTESFNRMSVSANALILMAGFILMEYQLAGYFNGSQI